MIQGPVVYDNTSKWPRFAQQLCRVDNLLFQGIDGCSIDMQMADDEIAFESLSSGRYFFRWFPFPHLIGTPLNDTEYSFYTILGKLSPRAINKFATPFHVLLAMHIYPWHQHCIRFLNVPPWCRNYLERLSREKTTCQSFSLFDDLRVYAQHNKNTEFFSISNEAYFSILVDRQKKCEDIIAFWRKHDLLRAIHVTPDYAIETTLEADCKYRELIEEEILCYHDELICQMIGEKIIPMPSINSFLP